MVVLLVCRGGVRTFAAARCWRSSLACLLGALAAAPGSMAMLVHRRIAFRPTLACGRFRFQAVIKFFGFFWTHHRHFSNAWSARGEGRIFFWRRDVACERRCRRRGRRGLCSHGWRTWRRGRDICRWCGFRPFAPFALFAAFQDDAAVFGHSRPAGLYPMLLQQIRNGRIGQASLTQFHDGIMDGFQPVERDAMRNRPELLNRLAKRFKIGRWCGWCVHNF